MVTLIPGEWGSGQKLSLWRRLWVDNHRSLLQRMIIWKRFFIVHHLFDIKLVLFLWAELIGKGYVIWRKFNLHMPISSYRYTDWSELISKGIVPLLLMEFREWYVHAPCAATMSGVWKQSAGIIIMLEVVRRRMLAWFTTLPVRVVVGCVGISVKIMGWTGRRLEPACVTPIERVYVIYRSIGNNL